MAPPIASPISPEMSPIAEASNTISRRMRQREAPMARLMPISRVRSATAMAMVLIVERPPTSRLSIATPVRTSVKMALNVPSNASKSLPVMTV